MLIPRTPQHNILTCKWVYRIEQDEQGRIARHKVKLITNSMQQIDGVDFQETFALVVKLSMIRLVLSIAISNGWSLRQLDVLNTFLHGVLKEEVFTSQPTGLQDGWFLNHVYRLLKSIYGMK